MVHHKRNLLVIPTLLSWVGGGTVGVDELSLLLIEGPEIEIVGNSSIKYGLHIDADHVHIQGLAIYGFGYQDKSQTGNIFVGKSGLKAKVSGNCLGSPADKVADPGENRRTEGSNLIASQADSVTVVNNIMAWAGVAGIFTTKNADGWWIENNEVVHNNQVANYLDGIDVARGKGSTVIGNRIAYNKGNGIDTYQSLGQNTLVNNTVIENGSGKNETSGIRLYGLDNQVKNNIIAENTGAGVLVTSSAERSELTQNSIYLNGVNAEPMQIGIDLLNAAQNHKRGNAPFATQNDMKDRDEGGNGLLNYPVLDKAMLVGDILHVAGWSRAGATVEFFLADRPQHATPQGKEYLFTMIEGSLDDEDTTYSGYDFAGTWGADSTQRFEFSFPASTSWKEGMALVTTATINRTTSEFSPPAMLTKSHIVPLTGCLQALPSGGYQVSLGYQNHSSDTIEVPVGADNYLLNGQGVLPTVFYPGTHSSITTVTFSDSVAQWVLQGQAVILTSDYGKCPVDLGIFLSANQVLVLPEDTVWLTALVENTSSSNVREASVEIMVPSHTKVLQAIPSSGSFQLSSGNWTIGKMLAGEQDSVMFQLVISENTLVEGTILSASQPDNNPTNNQSIAHVAIDESSSGEDGGTESNGNLASKIAVRNYQRQKYSSERARVASHPVFTHAKVHAGTISSATAGMLSARTEKTNEHLLLIPENSSASSQAVVVTPADLIGITNADEVFSVDYLNTAEKTLGSILYIRTEGRVYEHTKVICDRLKGGALTDIRHTPIHGNPFILSRVDQPNGNIDYAVSFVAYQTENGYVVDNRWRNEEYQPRSDENVLNFQVWSVSPTHTAALVDTLLTAMAKQGAISFRNHHPAAIPGVYVKSGYYEKGQLHLTVTNTTEAQQADVWGTLATTEDGARTTFMQSVSLKGTSEYQVSLPLGQVFDAGLTLANGTTGGMDALYIADGPWGVDYEAGGANITNFTAQASNEESEEGEYRLERNAQMEGRVSTYASLFRSLRPGLVPVDLQAYNQFSFTASGNGNYEVILTKQGIHTSAEQFRYTFSLDYEEREFTVPFTWLTDRFGNQKGNFSAEDITSVVFNTLGDNERSQPFSIGVDNFRFQSTGYVLSTEPALFTQAQVVVSPNPVLNHFGALVSGLTPGEEIEVEIVDLLGQVIIKSDKERANVDGTWQWKALISPPPGVYLLKVHTSQGEGIFKFVKQ